MVRTMFAIALLISPLMACTQPLIMLDNHRSAIMANMRDYELFYKDKEYVEYINNDTTIAYEFVGRRSVAVYLTIPTDAVDGFLERRVGKNWVQTSSSTYDYYSGVYEKPIQVKVYASVRYTTFEFRLWSSANQRK